MSNGRYFGVSIGTIIIGLLVFVAVWSYGQSLTEDPAIQRFGAIATAIAAVGGFLAFVILVFYTIETRLLRKATEEQLEGGIKPVLLFEISSAERKLGEAMNLTTFHLKNVGPGPAFNVRVAPIVGDGVQLDVDDIPLIESKGTKVIDWFIAQDGKRSGMSRRRSKARRSARASGDQMTAIRSGAASSLTGSTRTRGGPLRAGCLHRGRVKRGRGPAPRPSRA